MDLNQLQKIIATKKRGTYFTIEYKKEINGYKKTTKAVVRLASYGAVAKKDISTIKTNPNETFITHDIIYNSNTGKTCLRVFTTNGKYHKPHSVYEYMGTEITKEQWYEGTKTKPSNHSMLYNIQIENIIAVY